MPEGHFPPLPEAGGDLNPDRLTQWLANQTVSFQKIITGALQVNQVLSSSNYVAGTSGWQIDGDGNAEFNDVTVRGDIASSNWDGADPADLSSTEDATATLGYYLDASAGAAQFMGDFFLGGNFKFIAAEGILDFGDGFDMRVYQDNPVAGEDTLWIRQTATDSLDHVVIGPSTGANLLKQIRLRADTIELNNDGDFTHTFPQGIIYDHGIVTATSGLAFTSSGTELLQVTAAVPDGVAVTVFVWGWFKFDNAGDQDRRYAYAHVAGSLAGASTASTELDLTTGSGGTGATGSGGTGSTGAGGNNVDVDGNTGGASAGTAHIHSADGSLAVNGTHTHTGPSHTHTGPSHTHTLQSQEQTLHFSGARSYTPSGTTASIQLFGLVDTASATAGGRHLMYLVVVD